jgi:hypothetical protein
MAKEKVLITVKTYPTYSKSYDELVCTAGFKEDGSFIRMKRKRVQMSEKSI